MSAWTDTMTREMDITPMKTPRADISLSVRMVQWLLALAFAIVASALPDSANAQIVEYVHTDALGSPVAITNAAGQVIERTQYDPYGSPIGETIDGPGYTGHVMDAVTGLAYMQQRYYDPMVGRFLSVDPVTAYGSEDLRLFNHYAYAFNSPYKFRDPDGRTGCTGTRISSVCDSGGVAAMATSTGKYTGNDISLVKTERSTTPAGGSREGHAVLVPGSSEYKSEARKLEPGARQTVANAMNSLGRKLDSRGVGAEMATFRSIKVAGIEVNPSTAHGASYSAKAFYSESMILFNPSVFFGMSSLRQSNRTAHEFRHLMDINHDIVGSGYNALSDPSEEDARSFATELFGIGSR